MNVIKNTLSGHPLLAFFVLAYGISWSLWLPAVVAHFQNQSTLADGTLFFILGNFGPSLAALFLTAVSNGKVGVRALLGRLLHWRVGVLWYLIALYGFFALGLLSVMLFGVASPQDVLPKLPAGLINVPANALTIFLFLGPLEEELGWRGYALPRLQIDHGALSASVLLGILWAFWHSPLMIFPEWRSDLPIGAFLIAYPLYIIPLAIIFTWVYNNTNGSVFITMVLHAAFNYTVYTLNNWVDLLRYDPHVVQWAINGLLWLVAVALIGSFGPTHLSRLPTHDASKQR